MTPRKTNALVASTLALITVVAIGGQQTPQDRHTRLANEQGMLVCGTVDQHEGRMIDTAMWPKSCRKIGLYVDPESFSPTGEFETIDDVRESIQKGADWFDGFDVEVFVTDDPSDEVSQCFVAFIRLQGGVLAWSHLADGDCSPDKQQRYDLKKIGTKKNLVVTSAHEIGHLLGMRHRSGPYLMNPFIHYWLTGLTPQDERDLLALGYKRANTPPDPTPTPPTPKPPGDGATVTFRVGDEIKFVIDEVELTAKLTAIAGGTPQANPIQEAINKVPQYPLRNEHQKILAVLYGRLADSLDAGQLKPSDVSVALSTVVPLLLAGDARHWQPLLDLQLTEGSELAEVGELLGDGEASIPWLQIILPIVKQMVDRWEDSPRKTIALFVINLLMGLQDVD